MTMKWIGMALLGVTVMGCASSFEPTDPCESDPAGQGCLPEVRDETTAPPAPGTSPDPGSNPTPDPTPTPDPNPAPTPDPNPTPDPEPTPEPTPDPQPDPTPDPEPTPEPDPEPAPDPDSVTPSTVEVRLTWDSDAWFVDPDLDIFYCQEGAYDFVSTGCVWFQNPQRDWGPGDGTNRVSLVDSKVPGVAEVLTHHSPAPGRYHLAIYAYDMGDSWDSTATLTIRVNGVQVFASTELFVFDETMWYAAVIDWPQTQTPARFTHGPTCRNDGHNTCRYGLYEGIAVIDPNAR
jgi:hypothetical protein